ncbi:MAG: ribulose-phosphate 3-epimerase [Anaerolineaceae bacterium]|nr:ribulose-phosphate 3-epimerase [Anaerolineaceae bacterium]
MTVKLAPSILAADWTRMGQQIAEAEAAGADWIHIDVMDGNFVPNISFGQEMVAAARRSTQLPLDVHLMIVEPLKHLESFARAGATRISLHLEAVDSLSVAMQAVRKTGCACGVVINPGTPVEALYSDLDNLDYVLVMTVNPGFGGQEFMSETLPKVRALRTRIAECGSQVSIGVDGGINADTAPPAVAAGADLIVAGSSVYRDDQPVAAGMEQLRRAIIQ